MLFVLFCVGGLVAQTDKLYHNDGTVIEGKILSETRDDIRIQSKYGTLTYQKADLTRVVRAEQAKTVATKPPATPTPLPSYMTLIPVGPVNPFAPPNIRPLIEYTGGAPAAPLGASALTTTATAAAATAPKP